MNITFENADKVNGLLTITIEQADYQEAVEKTLKNYRKKAQVPGFRPGMVPMGMIKKQYGTAVKIDEINRLMGDKLMAYIEKRIGDEDLKIDDMAEAVGMGRTVFYGKVRELVGVSPSDFLKQIRMQRAEQLISKSKMTFAEIAYSVGFTDPKYFTKCFKKQTGMTPSEYRSKESDGE